MKHSMYKWTVMFLLSTAGCKKEVHIRLQEQLVGHWELRQTSSFGGTINWPPGNGNTIQFNRDGHYIQMFNNTDTAYSISSAFRVKKEDNCTINLIMSVALNSTYNSHAGISNDTLYLDAGSCIADGGSSIYLRK